jgi:uncharacterized protein YlxW (UPF0749 family)
MITSPPTGGGPYASTHPKAWVGVTAEDIPQGWMDDMVKRLFDQLNRQLIRLEDTKKDETEKHDANTRAADARTLASLERTLDKLTRLEQQRALARETKVAAKNDDVLAALERRIDQLAAAARASSDPEKPQQ